MYGYIMIYHIHVYLRNDEPPAQWRWWVQAYLGWYTWNYLPMREPILGAHDIFDCPWSLVVCVHVQDKTHWFCHHDRSMNHYSIISVAPRATKFWTKNFRSRVVFQMRWLMCLMQRFLWIFFTMFSPFFDGWSWCPARFDVLLQHRSTASDYDIPRIPQVDWVLRIFPTGGTEEPGFGDVSFLVCG